MKGGPLFLADYPIIDGNYAASFLDMIDTLVVGQLRESGVPMARIRAAYETMRKGVGRHPFAHNEFFTDGREIIAMAADELGDEVLAGVVSRQQFFKQARSYLKHIEYSSATQLAAKWRIAAGVNIDPDVSLGKPVVAGTGTTTYVVARSYAANDRDVSREHEVRALEHVLEKGTSDIDWMREIAGWDPKPAVIGGDGRILRNPVERAVLRDCDLTFVYLSKGWTSRPWNEFAWKIIRVWPEIVSNVERIRRPSLFEVPVGSVRVKLVSAVADLPRK